MNYQNVIEGVRNGDSINFWRFFLTRLEIGTSYVPYQQQEQTALEAINSHTLRLFFTFNPTNNTISIFWNNPYNRRNDLRVFSPQIVNGIADYYAAVHDKINNGYSLPISLGVYVSMIPFNLIKFQENSQIDLPEELRNFHINGNKTLLQTMDYIGNPRNETVLQDLKDWSNIHSNQSIKEVILLETNYDTLGLIYILPVIITHQLKVVKKYHTFDTLGRGLIQRYDLLVNNQNIGNTIRLNKSSGQLSYISIFNSNIRRKFYHDAYRVILVYEQLNVTLYTYFTTSLRHQSPVLGIPFINALRFSV